MITSITLQNFRAFQEEVTVRFRPITVLIGRNSAGKSSVIKFLLMLKQTLDSKADTFFVTAGSDVQLGTWKDLRNSNTRHAHRDDNLKFAVEVLTEDMPAPDIQEMWKVLSQSGAVSTVNDRIKLNLEFRRQPVRQENPKGRFIIRGRVFYGRKFKYGMHDIRGYLDRRLIFHKRTDNLETSTFLRFGQRTDSLSKMVEAIAAEPFLETLRQEFVSVRHLSPIREESNLTVQTGSPLPGYVGHRGEHAMPHLVRILKDEEKADKAGLILRYAEKVARIDRFKFESQASRLLTKIEGRNMDTGAVCSLKDFGFGVSQCLPMFVQGAMQHAGQLLVVEQPESQLHPTAQFELGSFFAELWTKYKVPSLIETHSGNALLRLRKLVKQQQLQPKDISVAYLTVEEVKRGRGGVTDAVVVKNLDVNPDGSLEKGLPMEFFGADLLEALEMGASKP
jgi:predicted ATPase